MTKFKINKEKSKVHSMTLEQPEASYNYQKLTTTSRI